MRYTDHFFEGKRPWSRIKDKILASYMTPYVAKVVRRGEPLLLIDAFAGPGKFDDQEPGSPLIMCQAAQKNAQGRYRAIFVNKKRAHHDQLAAILQKAGWCPAAQAVHGDSQSLLRQIVPLLTTQSVFLYLDPFGLKNCEFDTLRPFLDRPKGYSTEILINLCAPVLHRLAARKALMKGTGDIEKIARSHAVLTRTLGGDYWKDILLPDNGMDTKTREQRLVSEYRRRLSSTGYLTFTGACPIQASRGGRTKYYMIFAACHPDAMVLLNDHMCQAYNQYMHEQEIEGTLFAGEPWTFLRNTSDLVEIVVNYVMTFPGQTRHDLWRSIVADHFMQYTKSEYLAAVSEALEKGRLHSPTPRKTKRLNDECVLMPM